MTTTIIKSIGATGRDYTDLAGFFSASPSSLVSADEIWIGELYNDAEFTLSAIYTAPARTTDATRYFILRPASGQGFGDNASRLTNALRYNQSNGVAITTSADWSIGIDLMAIDYCHLQGLQIKETASYVFQLLRIGANSTVKNCIFFKDSTMTAKSLISASWASSACIIENNTLISKSGFEGTPIDASYSAATVRNNTVYTPVTADQNLAGLYGSSRIIKNNLIVGLTSTSTGEGAYSYNAADVSGVAGSTLVVVAANTFENVSSMATLDLRIKSGASVIGAGIASGGATTDALGQTRANPPTIGAFEYIGSGSFSASGSVVGAGAVVAGSATTTGSFSGSGAVAGASAVVAGAATVSAAAGTITIPAVWNWNTGALRTSETGVQVDVYDKTTGALVVRITGETTDGTTGDLVVSDSSIVAATEYQVIYRGTGWMGAWDYTAT